MAVFPAYGDCHAGRKHLESRLMEFACNTEKEEEHLKNEQLILVAAVDRSIGKSQQLHEWKLLDNGGTLK